MYAPHHRPGLKIELLSFIKHDLQQQLVSLSPARRFAWMGGQGTGPYEQKTQQSPDLGFSRAPHPVQS
jgi:hypothetical protein